MTAGIANVAKGRLNEYARRVNNNDPTNSAFVVALLQDTGLESLATLIDYDTLSALLGGTNTECSVASYSRLVLTDADIADPTVDDTADEQTFDTADFDFGALESGQTISASVLCYDDDTTAGDDTNLIPVHISIPAVGVATNGETFYWRTPSGLWAATEPA